MNRFAARRDATPRASRLTLPPLFVAPLLPHSQCASLWATSPYQLRQSRRVSGHARQLPASKRVSAPRRRLTASVSQPPRTFPVTFFNTTVHISGRLILMCVPAIWSSYAVIIKILYLLPWALSPALFNLLRLTVGALLGLPALMTHFRNASKQKSSSFRAALLAGFELGAWTITVNVMQMNALRYTTASRGAFLNQMSTIIVPIAAFLFGMEKRLSPNVMFASLVSIFGVALLTLDNVSTSFSLFGDGVMLLTAFVSAAYILRTKKHSKLAENGPLVSGKVLGQTTFAAVYFTAVALSSASPLPTFTAMFAGATPLLLMINIALVLWAGVFVCWLSTHMQVKGQKLVPASETVIIFTSMPLWASVWAWPLGERLGVRGVMGASLILGATAIAAAASRKREA